jgi:hypothetical protein
VLRGGDFRHPKSRASLQHQYARVNAFYPDVVAGLSCLFRPGASLDDLAREGAYLNTKISYSVIQRLRGELGMAGYELLLYVTPTRQYPDHHTLAVARGGQVEPTLADDALEALIRAMVVVDNPYQSGRP